MSLRGEQVVLGLFLLMWQRHLRLRQVAFLKVVARPGIPCQWRVYVSFRPTSASRSLLG